MNHNNRNTQKHFLRKTNIKRVLTPMLIVLMLLMLNIGMAWQTEIPIEKQIDKSQLIIKGKLIKKYYQRREGSFTNGNNGKTFRGTKLKLFTIFVFSVDEVLKGEYKKDNIEVMLLGGCEDGYCMELSFSYSYDVGEDGVIFLIERKGYPNTYSSRGGSNTAFRIDSNTFLHRKSMTYLVQDVKDQSMTQDENDKYSTDNGLTIDSLKLLISKEIKKRVLN